MTTRGIRGATTVDSDTKEDVLSSTRELLEAILMSNPELETDDIASVLFTVTEDIVAAYPAEVARQMGWTLVPMICSREIPVPETLPFCIRLLIHWNTDLEQKEINHIYLKEAKTLRPDIINNIEEK